MFLDLDHFKSINDRHGHAVGDACLKAVGDILRKHVRAGDLIARYGGEEFVLMIEGAGAQRALDAAESLRAAVNAEAIRVKPHRIVLSVSIGLSELRAEDEAAELLARADAALYRAKQNGRNRVEADFADKPGVSAP
jgi:diguanylate cyclase